MGIENHSRRLVSVLGPTAGGKSALAMVAAQNLGLQIVNCDSRQIYRGMDIGTAKPTPEDRGNVPHHLFDVVEPAQEFSAGEYSRLARSCLQEIWKTGGHPVLVGGTGFYFQALMEGIPDTVVEPGLREHLAERCQGEGLQALIDELRRLDPQGAAAVDLSNPRRVCRALEIVLSSGQTLKEARARRDTFDAQALVVIVTPDRESLNHRIDERVDLMLKAGLENEVRVLIDKWGWQAPGLRSIGYSEWKEHFQGTRSREEVIELIKTHTRQFAKRQLTWFRHQIDGLRICSDSSDPSLDVVSTIKVFLEDGILPQSGSKAI